MRTATESQRERLRANIDALTGLLHLAERLRRTNAAKWELTLEEWQEAVRVVLAAPVPHADDPVPVAEAVRAAQSAGMRLGNSGDARFGSASVGRHPDSSLAGARFYDDLNTARQRLAELQALCPPEAGAPDAES